LTIAKLH